MAVDDSAADSEDDQLKRHGEVKRLGEVGW